MLSRNFSGDQSVKPFPGSNWLVLSRSGSSSFARRTVVRRTAPYCRRAMLRFFVFSFPDSSFGTNEQFALHLEWLN